MKKLTILYCVTLLGFLLGIHNGRIALWEDGKQTPVKVFPYSAAMLPEKDRQALEKGIHFDDALQMLQLVQYAHSLK